MSVQTCVTLLSLLVGCMATTDMPTSNDVAPEPEPEPEPEPALTINDSLSSQAIPPNCPPVVQITNYGNGIDPATRCQQLEEDCESLNSKLELILNRVNYYGRLQTGEQTNDARPKDCGEIRESGRNISGRYAIYPADEEDPFFVFCDMNTDGGGWTVFQRRADGTVDFYLNWTNYKYGFGSVMSEHWLGNDKLHRLTSQRRYELRIDMEDFEEERRYAQYNYFFVSGEDNNYRLTVSGYHGDAGDSLIGHHNGMEFSTRDRDNDNHASNCAVMFAGAWWYNACHDSNLNGLYLGGSHESNSRGVNWLAWRGHAYSHKFTEMKIRPRNV